MRLFLSCLFFFSFSYTNSITINKNELKERCNFIEILQTDLILKEYIKNPSRFKIIYTTDEIKNNSLSLYLDKNYCSFLVNNYKKVILKEDNKYYKLNDIIVRKNSYKKNILDCIHKNNIISLKNNICILKDLSRFTTSTTTTTPTTTTTTTTTTSKDNTSTNVFTNNTQDNKNKTTTTYFPKTTNYTNTSINSSIITNILNNITTDKNPSTSQIDEINNLKIALSISGTIFIIVIISILIKYKQKNKKGIYEPNENNKETILETESLKEENNTNIETIYLEPTPLKINDNFNSIDEMDE